MNIVLPMNWKVLYNLETGKWGKVVAMTTREKMNANIQLRKDKSDLRWLDYETYAKCSDKQGYKSSGDVRESAYPPAILKIK